MCKHASLEELPLENTFVASFSTTTQVKICHPKLSYSSLLLAAACGL